MANKKTFEQALERLEEIVQSMENENLGIENSFKLYKEGIKLSEFCSKCLEKIEQEVLILSSNDDDFKLEVFDNLGDNDAIRL